MRGGGARKREIDVSCSRLNRSKGGMAPGTTTYCVAAVPGALLRLSQELSLLHTMYVERKTLKICSILLNWKRCAAYRWRHILFSSYYWLSLIIAAFDSTVHTWHYKARQECNRPPESSLLSLTLSSQGWPYSIVNSTPDAIYGRGLISDVSGFLIEPVGLRNHDIWHLKPVLLQG
jgi:hypothetical protein